MPTNDRVINTWTVGGYVFTEYLVTWLHADPQPLFGYTLDGKDSHERYHTLDKAMVAAVGEKWTGRRGAGGTAVGTAADWFAIMIGLEPAQVKGS